MHQDSNPGSLALETLCLGVPLGSGKQLGRGIMGACAQRAFRGPAVSVFPSQSVWCPYLSHRSQPGHGVSRKANKREELFPVGSMAKSLVTVSCRGQEAMPNI